MSGRFLTIILITLYFLSVSFPTFIDLTKGFVAMALDKYKFRLIESSQRQFHFLCSTPRLNEETESVQSVPADNFPQKPLPGVSVAEKPEQSSFKSASPEKEDTNVARKSATAATDPMPSTSDTKEPDADATHSVSTKADRDSSTEPDSQEQDLLTVKVASNSVTSRTDGTEDSDICIPDAELVAKDSVTSITDGAQVAEDPVTRIYDAKQVAQDSVTGVPDTKQFVRDSVTSAPDTKQVTEGKFTSLSDAEQTVKSSKKSGQENAIDGEMGDVAMSGNGAVEQPSQPGAGWKEFEDQYYKVCVSFPTHRLLFSISYLFAILCHITFCMKLLSKHCYKKHVAVTKSNNSRNNGNIINTYNF